MGELGLGFSPSHAHSLDKIFESVVEPHLLDPTFVYDYPVVLSPLRSDYRAIRSLPIVTSCSAIILRSRMRSRS